VAVALVKKAQNRIIPIAIHSVALLELKFKLGKNISRLPDDAPLECMCWLKIIPISGVSSLHVDANFSKI